MRAARPCAGGLIQVPLEPLTGKREEAGFSGPLSFFPRVFSSLPAPRSSKRGCVGLPQGGAPARTACPACQAALRPGVGEKLLTLGQASRKRPGLGIRIWRNVMRKRWRIGVLILVVVGVAVALAFPATVYVPLGVLEREAFFANKPTSYWRRALKKEDFLGQAPAPGDSSKTLQEGGAAAVPVLCQIVEDPDPTVRYEALTALATIGPEARAAAPALATTLQSEEQMANFLIASKALARADPVTAAATFNALLRDEGNRERRSWVLAALSTIAPQCQETVPALMEMAHHATGTLRVGAITVLWQMHQPGEPLVPLLCETVRSRDPIAGVPALLVLGEIGPAAKAAVPLLATLLASPETPDVRGRSWGPPHRVALAGALGKIGPGAAPAIAALASLLDRRNPEVRLAAIRALALIGGGPAREALRSRLRVLSARQAVWWPSIMLLAAGPPAHVAAFPLAQLATRSWLRQQAATLKALREAVQKTDKERRSGAGA